MEPNLNPYENSQNNLDHNPYNYGPHDNIPYSKQNYGNQPKPNCMETFALSLGILSIVTCSCCYLSLPMGAIAILLALLSRGGNMKLGSKAKLAITVGVIGIVITLIMYAVCFYITLTNLEMFEKILREYCEQMELDFEMLYGDMFQYLDSLNIPQNSR